MSRYHCLMCDLDIGGVEFHAHDGLCIDCWRTQEMYGGAKKVNAMGFALYRKSVGNVSQQSEPM